MASRRKRTLLQADLEGCADFSVSLNHVYPPVPPSAASHSRSSTPGMASIEQTSADRRRIRRETFPLPSPGTASASLSGTPDVPDGPLAQDDIFADNNGLSEDHHNEEAPAGTEGEQTERAKRYMSSVSTPSHRLFVFGLTQS